MCGLHFINTPYERSPYGYATLEFTSAVSPTLTRFTLSGDDKEWDEEMPDDHKETCCEDDYDDDEDEDNEKEWCD